MSSCVEEQPEFIAGNFLFGGPNKILDLRLEELNLTAVECFVDSTNRSAPLLRSPGDFGSTINSGKRNWHDCIKDTFPNDAMHRRDPEGPADKETRLCIAGCLLSLVTCLAGVKFREQMSKFCSDLFRFETRTGFIIRFNLMEQNILLRHLERTQHSECPLCHAKYKQISSGVQQFAALRPFCVCRSLHCITDEKLRPSTLRERTFLSSQSKRYKVLLFCFFYINWYSRVLWPRQHVRVYQAEFMAQWDWRFTRKPLVVLALSRRIWIENVNAEMSFLGQRVPERRNKHLLLFCCHRLQTKVGNATRNQTFLLAQRHFQPLDTKISENICNFRSGVCLVTKISLQGWATAGYKQVLDSRRPEFHLSPQTKRVYRTAPRCIWDFTDTVTTPEPASWSWRSPTHPTRKRPFESGSFSLTERKHRHNFWVALDREKRYIFTTQNISRTDGNGASGWLNGWVPSRRLMIPLQVCSYCRDLHQ